MNELQRKQLGQNRVRIVSDLEPKGKVLDTLYEDGVLTENDLEFVSSAKTRKERCHILLSLLPTRGPSAYGSFRKALESGKYDFLANQLSFDNIETLQDQNCLSQRHFACAKGCKKCKMFLKNVESKTKGLNISLYRIVTDHCCLLLDNIEPKDVIDQLFQDQMIAEDDIDRIVTHITRRDRCKTLFEILLGIRNNRVVESLKRALWNKYAYIVENISYNLHERQLLRKASKSQTQEGVEEQHFEINPNDLLKARLVESPMQHSDWCLEGSNATPKVLTLRSDSTDPELNVQDHDYNLETDMKMSATCPVKIRTKNDIMSQGDDLTGAKHSKDGMQPLNVAFLDKSVKRYTSEIVHAHNKTDTTETVTNYTLSLTPSVPSVKQMEKETDDGKLGNGHLHNGERQKKRTPANNLQNLDTSEEENAHTFNKKTSKTALVQMQITAIQSENPRKRLTMAFNHLSTLINQGNFNKFEEISFKLQNRFQNNYDLMCIIGYLQTSKDLFQNNFDSAKNHIDYTMTLVPKSTNPRYFTLELFTAKSRMYITQKKLQKLQTTLDEAGMILETDPVNCTGRAAGWHYLNDARNNIAKLSCLNLKNPNALTVYERLFENAKANFHKSMANFKRDSGKDGPFGFGYALCRLVILLLRCGDNGLTMNSLIPLAGDIQTAGQYLQHLEDSNTANSKILEMHFRLAKCDYQFRRGNCVRALEHAQIAYDLATEMRLFEYKEHIYNRVSFLEPKSFSYFVAEKNSEEETQRILLEESSQSDPT